MTDSSVKQVCMLAVVAVAHKWIIPVATGGTTAESSPEAQTAFPLHATVIAETSAKPFTVRLELTFCDMF